ncbi:alpha-tubulin N-acetyltransferase 1 isoform X2 [Syngnathoides biaculeatus]|uniref:alpha-tubulin N-acetyltransferase 1 isoform X2 n=1 Tax=Syngnathoides biaculeatus TaxID=300417 RepID=UPI002ADD746D|nr:alpha-tubulin N-acetyltransferase 1 isoform X2 [Syngnathoides biaculeatus]
MEFPFNINHLFSDRFSVLDNTFVASRVSQKRPDLQSHIATVIDEMGRASAKAQKLTTPVTSAAKLQSQHHQLYLMKDGESKGGCGAIVGFLKVGYKKLFLLDQQGLHIEAEPLCVLDFFIAENSQRHGYGLELFNFMLQHKTSDPVQLAYDRPSPKLLSFLAKHYCLTQSVPQVNNFVVFDGFFLNKSVEQSRMIPLKKPDTEIKPYSIMEREAVRQERRSLPWPFVPPHSPQRLVSSQFSLSLESSPTKSPLRASTLSAPGVHRDQSPNFPLIERSRERRTSQQGQVARDGLYSRYMDNKSLGMLGRPLPGLRSVGDRSQVLRRTETHRLVSVPILQSRLVTHPLPSATKDNVVCRPTSLTNNRLQIGADAELAGVEKKLRPPNGTGNTARVLLESRRYLLARERDISRSGCCCIVGNTRFAAQQVKQMLLNRSTCPW